LGTSKAADINSMAAAKIIVAGRITHHSGPLRMEGSGVDSGGGDARKDESVPTILAWTGYSAAAIAVVARVFASAGSSAETAPWQSGHVSVSWIC
jgi:hypothetical protein